MTFKKTILAGIATITTTITVKSSPIAQTHQIFWDSSNDLFQSERNPTKQVRLGDRLDITCGHGTNLGNAYLVNDLHSFENCDSTSRRQVLFNCEKAGTKKTIKILEVNPHPFAPIFLAGQDYYLVGGNCAHENLRMIIRVDREVVSDGLARVVTEEMEYFDEDPEVDINIQKPSIPETPRVVIPMITTSNSESLSDSPDDFSANNTQLNQLLIGVALGVLIFLILVFSSILIYLKFCGKSKNNKPNNKINKVTDVENSSESGIGYTFKQAPVINTMYQNRQMNNNNNFQPSLNQYYQTIQAQNHHHYQSNFRKGGNTTQTYTNMPLSRQIVGEPSVTGNAFLSIAKRVDPAYAHDLTQEISQENSNQYDSIDSGKNNSNNGSSRGSSEPLLNPSRDIGYEGSQETTSSQISPQSGFKASCQPRLENGGLVISV